MLIILRKKTPPYNCNYKNLHVLVRKILDCEYASCYDELVFRCNVGLV